MINSDAIRQAAEAIDQADGLIITAGAGMGVDSGLPDFRGDSGFWSAYPALGQAGLHFHDIACATTFLDDPTLAWGFYGHRLRLYRETIPNPGFAILREFARYKEHGAFVYTSNVDGQFQKAGFPDSEVVECHGSIHFLQCQNGCLEHIWPATAFQPEVDQTRCRLLNSPPRCPQCGEIARPNIVMFEDLQWLDRRFREREARLKTWLASIRHLVVIEIGAGGTIPTVRHYGERQSGFLIRINPREADLPAGCQGVGLALPGLVALSQIQGNLRRRYAT